MATKREKKSTWNEQNNVKKCIEKPNPQRKKSWTFYGFSAELYCFAKIAGKKPLHYVQFTHRFTCMYSIKTVRFQLEIAQSWWKMTCYTFRNTIFQRITTIYRVNGFEQLFSLEFLWWLESTYYNAKMPTNVRTLYQ